MTDSAPLETDAEFEERYRLGMLLTTTPIVDVHHGYDERLQRDVSLRLVRSEVAGTTRSAFEAAAQAMAPVIHPNVRPVWDVGPHGGRLCVVTEPGATSLHDELAGGTVSQGRVAEVALQCLAALDAAHDLGVVHGPIAPSSVTIADAATTKLGDFTRVSSSPEARSEDLAALAHMCSGLVGGTGVPSPGSLGSILARATSPDPGVRFDSAAEMARALVATTPEATGVERDGALHAHSGDDPTVAAAIDPTLPGTALHASTPARDPDPTATAVLPLEVEQRVAPPARVRATPLGRWRDFDKDSKLRIVAAAVVALALVLLATVTIRDQDAPRPDLKRPEAPADNEPDLPAEIPR